MYWLIVLMILQLESFLLRTGLIKFVLHLHNVSMPLIFLLGPFLYFYILNQIGKRITLTIKTLHILPFLFYFGYSFNYFLQSQNYKLNVIVEKFHPNWEQLPVEKYFSVDPWNIQGWIVVEVLTLHLLIYGVLCFYIIKNSKKITNSKNWLLYLTGILTFGGLILFFSQGGIINEKVFFKSPFPQYSADVFSTVAMYLIMMYFILKIDFRFSYS